MTVLVFNNECVCYSCGHQDGQRGTRYSNVLANVTNIAYEKVRENECILQLIHVLYFVDFPGDVALRYYIPTPMLQQDY